MKRRTFLGSATALGTAPWKPARAQAPSPSREKVLRYAFAVAETGFDPVQVQDTYSRFVTAHVFEAPLSFDHLARPFKLRLVTAAEMPQASDDSTEFVIRLRPGIYFTDHPAFNGKPRELVAADYVYSWKRFFDPFWNAPYLTTWEILQIAGLNEYREELLKSKQPFDYDRPIEGLRALDRYTVRIKTTRPAPRLLYTIASPDTAGAVAREVAQVHGKAMMEHPVGTGPFKLHEWRRSSRIVLVRNPAFREVFYDAQPNDDDAAGQALKQRFRGRRLPMVDRVEIAVIEESQPRYLAFLNNDFDLLERVPLDFSSIVVPGGRLAPGLARRGIQLERIVMADLTMTLFNMDDPVLGGLAPEKIALRRAINLAFDVDKEIRLLRRGQAIPAQGPLLPLTYGYDPAFRSEMGVFDRARAVALLDLYGYVDRDGDGWREMPDGSPLVLRYSTQPDQLSRQMMELWQKDMNAVGLRIEFSVAKWPEQMKRARVGSLMMWGVGLLADSPDGQNVFARGYGPDIGAENIARFHLPEFDRLYDRAAGLPDGPERLSLFRDMNKILIAYAPYKFHCHRIFNDLSQPWLVGYRRPPFWSDWWPYVDVDADAQARGHA